MLSRTDRIATRFGFPFDLAQNFSGDTSAFRQIHILSRLTPWLFRFWQWRDRNGFRIVVQIRIVREKTEPSDVLAFLVKLPSDLFTAKISDVLPEIGRAHV